MLRNMRVARKLPLLVGIIAAAFVAYACAALLVLQHVKIGGAPYRAISLDKELLADVLPPPAYLVEADLVAHQLVVAAGDGHADEVAATTATLERLETEYEARIGYWETNLVDPEARRALLDVSVPAGRTFFTVVRNELLPAIDAGRLDEASAVVDGPLAEAYTAHRAGIDVVVERSLITAADHEAAATASVRQWITVLIGGLCVTLVVAALLAQLVSRSIVSPLGGLQHGLEAIAGGAAVDTVRLDAERRDELGAVAASFNTFAERMAARVAELDRTSAQLVAVATSMDEAAESVCAGMQTVASATTEMDASINEISRTASDAAQVSVQAVEAVREALARMAQLHTSSGRIAEAVITIGQITDKTNLLALNAHIEAEHAGESGRGFAVVAHEVKELARRTGHTTSSIGAVVSGTGEDVMAATEAMQRITAIIADVSEASTVIAAAVEEQTAAMREIVGQVELAAARGVEIQDAVRGAKALVA